MSDFDKAPPPPAKASPPPPPPAPPAPQVEGDPQAIELRGHQEHGAQVVLSRAASAAARGGVASTQMGNILAKRALEASGEQADGHSPDGTSVTGKRQADDVLAEQTDDPSGPATGVKPADGLSVFDAAGLQGTSHTPTPDGKGGPASGKA